MASLGDVSRYLRQRRAVGKPITDLDRSAAWNAYFDTEATKQIQRGELALKSRSLDITESQNAEQLRLAREAQDAQEKAGMVSGVTQLGQLAYMGSKTDLGKSLISGAKGLYGKATGAQAATAGSVGTAAQGTAVSSLGSDLAGVSTQLADKTAMLGTETATAATTGATLASTATAGVAGAAAGLAADKLFGDKWNEAGSVVGGATTGFMIGGPVGAVVGAVFGQITSKLSDSWICTKTKTIVGMTEHEWATIGRFRQYAQENHSDWLQVYVDIGPALLEKINGDEEFYSNLKDTFINPVIKLTEGGFMEAAYLTYKSVVMELIDKYNPELTKEYPEVE